MGDIPRVGCPPRRRPVKAHVYAAQESTMSRGSVFESMGSPGASMPMQSEMEASKAEDDEPEEDGPYWVTQPHHMLQLGPCLGEHGEAKGGYCLRPSTY